MEGHSSIKLSLFAAGLFCLMLAMMPVYGQLAFVDVAPSYGLDIAEGCGDVIWYDFDNDGDLDLLVTHNFSGHNFFYQNDGNSFPSLAVGLPQGGCRPIPADFDHDGDLDILFRCHNAPTVQRLMVREGDYFFDRTVELGLPETDHWRDCAWVDVDHDGWVDLIAGNAISGFHVFRNNLGTRFDDITAQTSLPPYSNFSEMCEADVNFDGEIEMFMTRLNGDDHYYVNDGNAHFRDMTVEAGLAGAIGETDCIWADFDNDLFPDLLTQASDHHTIWHNNGNGTFTEMNVHGTTDAYYTSNANYAVGDFNMDKKLDFYAGRPGNCAYGRAPNQFFIQDTCIGLDIWFTDVAPALDMDFMADCTPTVADFDNDGRLDLSLAGHEDPFRLLRNVTPLPLNFLQVLPLGPNGEQDRWHTRVEIYPHGSFQAVAASELNSSNVRRSGMSNYFVVDQNGHYDLRIHFASGVVMTPEQYPYLSDVVPSQIGHLLTVRQGQQLKTPPAPPTTPMAFALNGVYPNPFNATTGIRYSVAEDGMARMAVYNLSGQRVAEILNGFVTQGEHVLPWNASGLATGVYLLELRSGARVVHAKAVLLK
jgi:hypothetical protein